MQKNTGNWIPKETTGNPFFIECNKIINDDILFENFKRNNIFCAIIGNDVRDNVISNSLYNRVKDTVLYKDIEKYKTNDIYGNPVKYYYDDIGYISPGTLYFIDVLADILNKFNNIDKLNILEIGSGYGGQAKIILDYGIKEYTCLDVKEPLSLCKKYLDLFEYTNVKYIDVNNIETNLFDKYDLVISNWCLSEFDINGMEYYIEHVIKFINKGYFLMNIWENDRKEFLIENMKKYFTNIYIEEEKTKTNSNNNFLLYIEK